MNDDLENFRDNHDAKEYGLTDYSQPGIIGNSIDFSDTNMQKSVITKI